MTCLFLSNVLADVFPAAHSKGYKFPKIQMCTLRGMCCPSVLILKAAYVWTLSTVETLKTVDFLNFTGYEHIGSTMACTRTNIDLSMSCIEHPNALKYLHCHPTLAGNTRKYNYVLVRYKQPVHTMHNVYNV